MSEYRVTYPRALTAAKSQLGWLPAGGNSNVLTLLSAGHVAGLYLFTRQVRIDVAGTAGTFSTQVAYSSPTLGAHTFSGFSTTVTSTAAGIDAAATTYTFESDGTAAITATMVPSGITGTPQVSFWAACQLFGF